MLVTCVSASSTENRPHLTTLQRVAAALGVTTSTADGTLDGAYVHDLISLASEWAETYVGYPLVAQVYSETVRGSGGRHLLLGRTPIRYMLRVFDSSSTCEASELKSTEYRVEDAEAGLLSRDIGFLWSNVQETFLVPFARPNMDRKPWLVEYAAGYLLTGAATSDTIYSTVSTSTGRDLPYDVEQAVVSRVLEWYEGAAGVTSKRVGDLAITYSESAGSEAERLLMPWRRMA